MSAEVVGEVKVRVGVLDDGSFPKGIQNLLEGAQGSVDRAARSIDSSLGKAFDGGAAGASRLSSAIRGAAQDMSTLGEAAKSALQLGGIAGVTKMGINLLQSLGDQAALTRMQIDSAVGTAAGPALYKAIVDLGVRSAASADSLATLGAGLASAGMAAQDVIPFMENLGDAVKAQGGVYESVAWQMKQMAAKGRVSMEELTVMAESGFRGVEVLSKGLGLTMQETTAKIAKGTVTFQDFQKALRNYVEIKDIKGLGTQFDTVASATNGIGDAIRTSIREVPAFIALHKQLVDVIGAWANRISDPDIQESITRVTTAFAKLFGRLLEVQNGLGTSAFNIALKAVEALTPAVEALANAINAIPLPVLEALFAVLAVNRLANVGKGLAEITSRIKDFTATTAASGAGAATLGSKLKDLAGSRVAIAGVLATVGALTSELGKTSVAASTAGDALTGAAMGFAVAGPWGALAGGAFAGLTSYLNSVEAAHKAKLKEIYDNTVSNTDAIIRAEERLYGDGSSKAMDSINRKLSDAKRELADATALRREYEGLLNAPAPTGSEDERIATIEARQKRFDELKKMDTEGMVTAARASVEEYAKALDQGLTDKLKELNLPGTVNAALQGKDGSYEIQLKSFEEIEKALQQYGISWEQAKTMSIEQINEIVAKFRQVPDEIRRQVDAINALAAKIDLTSGIADKVTAVGQSIASSMTDGVDSTEGLANSMALVKLRAEVMAQALAAGATQVGALALANEAAARAMAVANVASQESIDKLATLAGVIANISDHNDIIVNVGLKGMEAALQQIAILDALLKQMAQGTNGTGSSSPVGQKAAAAAAAQKRAIEAAMAAGDWGSLGKLLGVDFGAQVATQVAASDAEVLSRLGGGSTVSDKGLSEFASAYERASSTLTDAIEENRKAVEALTDSFRKSIKERTQYDAATSTRRLLKNATRQAADLAQVDQYAKDVTARGLSQEALTSIIDSLGVEDLKQLKKLNGSSSADLVALSKAVESRDNTAARVAEERSAAAQKATMVSAIVEAAKILGYNITPEQAANVNLTVNGTDVDTATKNAIDQILGLSGSLVKR